MITYTEGDILINITENIKTQTMLLKEEFYAK